MSKKQEYIQEYIKDQYERAERSLGQALDDLQYAIDGCRARIARGSTTAENVCDVVACLGSAYSSSMGRVKNAVDALNEILILSGVEGPKR